MFRRIQIAFASAAVLLATSGCMKVNLDLTVKENDTVSGSMILAFSNDAIELAKSMGSDSSLNTDSLVTEEPGMTVEQYKDSDYAGTKITFDERPFAEFSTGTSADSLSFKRDGSIVSITGAINMAGDDPAAIEQIRTNPITSGLFDKSDISVSITMPGKILESSGTVVGNTVTFKGELGDNIVIDVKADTSASMDFGLLAAGGLALAGVVTAGVLLLNRRKSIAKPEAPTQSQFSDWE